MPFYYSYVCKTRSIRCSNTQFGGVLKNLQKAVLRISSSDCPICFSNCRFQFFKRTGPSVVDGYFEISLNQNSGYDESMEKIYGFSRTQQLLTQPELQ